MSTKKWISETLEVDDYSRALDLFWDKGWTDGLPIVPPTEERVAQFLDYVGLEPDHEVCRIVERNRVITAEKLAINAVMAGCLPEYMPVLIAAAECLGAPEYKLNHLASAGSLWVMTIVNGPVAKRIGLNAGMYCFGAGVRANCTIARAISLLLANCAEARIGGIQRGQFGQPGRFNFCIAENEDMNWGPSVAEMQGQEAGKSAVTIKEIGLGFVPIRCNYTTAEGILRTVAGAWPFPESTVLLFFPPPFVDIFKAAGWSRDRVRQHLRENIRFSVADLKGRGAYHRRGPGELAGVPPEIEVGDEKKYVHPYVATMQERQALEVDPNKAEHGVSHPDIIPVVAGGDAGLFVLAMPATTDWPLVTRLVKEQP